MADWTPQQLEAMQALVLGTHDRLDPVPRHQPGYTMDQIYGGILPAASPTRTAVKNAPRTPALTPAQQAAFRDVPKNAFQTRPVDIPNAPRGFSNVGGDQSRLPQGLPNVAPWLEPGAQPTPMEDALIAAGVRPGIPLAQQQSAAMPKPPTPEAGNWLEFSRMLAKAGFRQAAVQAANAKPPASAPPGPVAGPNVMASPPRAPTSAQTNPGVSAALAGRLTTEQAMAPNGYIYGRSGNGPWAQQDKMPWASVLSPSAQYDIANAASAMNAKARQATLSGTAGGQIYSNGQRVGTVGGVSSATAYDQANAAAKAAAQAKATTQYHQSSGGGGSGDWFTSARGW